MNINYRRTPVLLAVGTLLAAGALTACSSSLPQSDVESTVLANLQEVATAETDPSAVACPNDLEATIGATMTCDLSFPDGTSREVVVTVDKLVDGKAFFNLQLTDAAE